MGPTPLAPPLSNVWHAAHLPICALPISRSALAELRWAKCSLSDRGQVIYLKVSVETQWERLKDTTDRPFLKTANPKIILQQLQNDREAFYQEIKNFVIDTDSKTPEEIVEEILYGIKYLSVHVVFIVFFFMQ